MRADRLVAALLFLQTRGPYDSPVTAAELAAELEVSERTARRDLEALAAAGIPVYSTAGRGGGWRLVGGARTDLSGLTVPEIRELFLLAGPGADTTTLRKLVRALPAPLRAGAEAAARSGVTDTTDWTGTGTEPPHLRALRQAVVDGVRVRLGYARPGREASSRVVHPLGIAAKAGVPYLVAGTGAGTLDDLRPYRISRVTSVTTTAEPVARPADFDLAAAWRALAARMEDRMVAATVRGRAAPGTEGLLEGLFGGRLRYGAADPENGTRNGADGRTDGGADGRTDGRTDGGWYAVEIDGPSPEVVAAQAAGLGARLELTDPPEARAALARIGAELSRLYGRSAPTPKATAPDGPGRAATPPA